jgi:antitoxin YefM
LAEGKGGTVRHRLKVRYEPSCTSDMLGKNVVDIFQAVLYIFMYMYRRCNMEAITYTNARQNLAKTMEKVCQDHSPVIVTRKKNDSVVIMSFEDYKALEETAYLLRSPKNTRRLIESISQLENDEGTERDLVD